MLIMTSVKQEDPLGCAVACTAFILGIKYSQAIKLFSNGHARAKQKSNFYCPEITRILNGTGLGYQWGKVRSDDWRAEVYQDYSIIFLPRSDKYSYGHFLVRYHGACMDPWINIPNPRIKSGFRTSLQGSPTYVIYRVKTTRKK